MAGRKKNKLTAMQKRFVDEYIISGNATQAAVAAGYSPNTAGKLAHRNLGKPQVKEYLKKRLRDAQSKKTATAQEIMEYLTSVVRGESRSEEIVVEGMGEGRSEARAFNKAPSEKDRIQAAALLAKRFGLNMTELEFQARLERLQLENDKLRLENEKLKGGPESEVDDGFLKALGISAEEVWNDEDA